MSTLTPTETTLDLAAPSIPRLTGITAWISNTAQLISLKTEWRELAASLSPANAFLSFEWMSTWWQQFGKDAQLALITVRDSAGTLLGLAPFYISRQLGLRRLGFLADQHAGSDYLDILCVPGQEEAVVEEVARTVRAQRSRWDYIELKDTADSETLRHFAWLMAEEGLHVNRAPASVCPYVSLPETFDAYTASISGQFRRDVNRRWRTLQRDHAATFETFSSVDDIRLYFPELCRLHGLRFDSQNRDSAFLQPSALAFFSQSVEALAKAGVARMFILRAGPDVIAALLGFSVGKQFQYFQLGLDPNWSRSGPGKVLLSLVIEAAIRNGHTDFDFLRGGESYKASWTSTSRATFVWRFFDNCPASLAARAYFFARQTVSKMKHRWQNRAATQTDLEQSPRQ